MPAGWTAPNRSERIKYAAPLNGPYFETDNKKVWSALVVWIGGHKQPYNHIRIFETAENGRSAEAALVAHYDGPGEIQKQLSKYNKLYDSLHYRSEQSYPFAKFVSQMQKCFFVFEKANVPKLPRVQVIDLYKKIKPDNGELKMAIKVVEMNPALQEDFTTVTNSIMEQVALVAPATSTRRPRGNERFTSDVRTDRYMFETRIAPRGGGRTRGRGRGRGRGGRYTRNRSYLTDSELAAKPGGRPGDTHNGVDISDLRAQFPSHVYQSFPGWLKAKIYRAKHGTDYRNTSSVQLQTSLQDDVSTLRDELSEVRAVLQASRDNHTVDPEPPHPPTPPSGPTGGSAGTRFGRGGAYSS